MSRHADRLGILQGALEGTERFEALTTIREAIAEKNREQTVVGTAYACILETHSAGLSILLDRCDDSELDQIEQALTTIGAKATLADLVRLRALVSQACLSGASREEASDYVHDGPAGRAVFERTRLHVEEMEECLLAFCRSNIALLAAGYQGLAPDKARRCGPPFAEASR
jgi:hypothetical protein